MLNIISKITDTHGKIQLLQNVLLAFFIVLLLISSLWVKVYISSMNDYNHAIRSYEQKEIIKTINYLGRSMHWYAPFNPYVKRSADMLFQISRQAEDRGDLKISFIALNTVKNSIYSIRAAFGVYNNILEESEKRIKRILPKLKEGYDNSFHAETEYNDPDLFWTIILEIGLFGWITSTICFICFCLGKGIKSSRFLGRPLFWVPVFCFNYGIWILGMIKA